MRRQTLLIAIAAIFALATVAQVGAAVVQGQQQEEQARSVEGSLEAVDLEESKVVVKQMDESEITLVVNEDTVVRDSTGETTTLAALSGLEGQALTATFVEMGEENVALAIQLVAS